MCLRSHFLENEFFIFKPQDLSSIKDELIEVYISAYKGMEEYAYTKRSDIKRYIKWLYNADKDGIFVAKIGHKIVGFIFFCHKWWDRIYGEIGEIHELAIASEYKGQGIGKALMQKAMSSLGRYNNIFGLWVGEKNEVAKRFYKKFGFEEKGKVGKWIRMIKIKKE